MNQKMTQFKDLALPKANWFSGLWDYLTMHKIVSFEATQFLIFLKYV